MTSPLPLWSRAWDRLAAAARGAADPIVTFATWGPDGPQMRSVVLREADREAVTLTFFADLNSAKVAELRADPRAGLHLWDGAARLQLRATGLGSVAFGAEVEPAWQTVPPEARSNYGIRPAPGAEIPAPDAYEKPAERAAFCVVTLTLATLDVTWLTRPHQRAGFQMADGWAGAWRAP